MKKAMRIFGRALYLFASRMPESTSRVTFGAKTFRGLCGRLIMKSCGKKVNIEKGAVVTHDVPAFSVVGGAG